MYNGNLPLRRNMHVALGGVWAPHYYNDCVASLLLFNSFY